MSRANTCASTCFFRAGSRTLVRRFGSLFAEDLSACAASGSAPAVSGLRRSCTLPFELIVRSWFRHSSCGSEVSPPVIWGIRLVSDFLKFVPLGWVLSCRCLFRAWCQCSSMVRQAIVFTQGVNSITSIAQPSSFFFHQHFRRIPVNIRHFLGQCPRPRVQFTRASL